MPHLSERGIRILVGNLPSSWPELNCECLHMQLFLPLFPDLHSEICLETSPLNHTFQKSIYVPSDACTRFGCLKSLLFLQSQKSFLAVSSSILSITPGAKEGTDVCSLWRTWMCHQPPQGWAAPEMPTGSRACHQKLLQQTEQGSVQGDYNHSHPQRVWSTKGIPLSDKNRRLCREVSETDTDLIWKVKPFYSWSCSAALAVLTWADCNCQDCFLLSSHFPKSHYPISMESH